MKRSHVVFAALALAVFASGTTLALDGEKVAPPVAAKGGDPISEFLFPPEMVIKAAEQIGLDQSQTQAIRALLQEARAKLAETQQKLATDTATLRELLAAASPDQPKCLEQLDRVLEDEKSVKHINLSLMLDIKSRLTADQIAKLMALRDRAKEGVAKVGGDTGLPKAGGDAGMAKAGGDVPEALRAKLQDVRAKAMAKQQAGVDISGVKALVQEAQSLAQQGKLQEASAKLDEAASQLK
ncbi:MAG TPA: hypothetical protein VHM90_09200 [Phycisphaerae bacterium]|nr:hypothetical protein [Phycisphaerae bacterium]